MAKHANYCDWDAEEIIDGMEKRFQEAMDLLSVSQANLAAALDNLDKLCGIDSEPQLASVAPAKEEGDGARPEDERA